jgi:amino acid transporter
MTDSSKSSMAETAGRPIGLLGAYSIGIGGIIGGGIFATLGLAGEEARGATDLSFLVGGVVALLTVYSYVHLCLTYPSKGGTIVFINRAFGFGLFSGTLNIVLVLSYTILLAVYASALAVYGAMFFHGTDPIIMQKILAMGSIVVLAFVNLIGPELAEKSEGAFNIGKLSILSIFVVAGLMSSGLTLERLTPANWVPAADIVAGGMLVFLSYEGFELIANSAPRIRDPHKNLPRALYGSVLIAIAFYLLIIVVSLGHLSFEALSKARDYSLCAAAGTFMGHTGFLLLAAGAVLSTASAINAGLSGASKIPVEMSHVDQVSGVYMWQIHGRHPLGLAIIAGITLLTVGYLNLRELSAAASAGFILVFAMVNLSNAKLATQTSSKWWVSVVGALVCMAALATMLFQLAQHPASRYEIHVIAALVGLSFFHQLIYQGAKKWAKKGRA